MNINYCLKDNTCKFSDIGCGEAFLYDDCLYMKACYNKAYAVDLNNGDIVDYINMDDLVKRVSVNVTVKEYES